MRTYPVTFRADGSLLAFEITSAWITFYPIFKTLRSVEGVSHVKRNYFNDDRLSFTYRGERWVVNEPYGDNSRYWIGPERGLESTLDATPIQTAFQRFGRFPIRVWRGLMRASGA